MHTFGQRRGSERHRELWVTDLAKVAYGARANHTRQIQFNKLSVHRERRKEGREKERRVCILLKGFRVKWTLYRNERNRKRNRRFRVSFSPEIKDETRRKEKEIQTGKWRMSVGLCSPTKCISLVCIGCLSHKHVWIKKHSLEALPHERGRLASSLTHTLISHLLNHLFIPAHIRSLFIISHCSSNDWLFQWIDSVSSVQSLCLIILSLSLLLTVSFNSIHWFLHLLIL